MERKYVSWTIRSTTVKHRDDYIAVQVDVVIRPDGKPGTYSTVEVKPGVAILAIGDDGTSYLTRQFRYALGADSIEVACGGVERGESPEEAARKELREELGIEAAEWTALGTIDLDTSIVRCKMSLFVARVLTLGETEQEGSERIRTLKVPLGEAVAMVSRGEITHAASCVLILRAATDSGGRAC